MPARSAPAVTPMSTLAVNMPADLAARIERLAEENERSVDTEIRKALRAHIEAQSR